jgi:ribonucleoside-diphosphate reductase alpha chain
MWEQPSVTGYMNLVGIMQKFMDQAISGNTFYDPSKFGGKVPIKNIVKDIIYAYQIGWKTMYYHYTNDDDEKKDDNKDLPSSSTDGEDCESCKV